MKAQITGIYSSENGVIFHIAIYLSENDVGYDKSVVDITDEEGQPTGEKHQNSVNTTSLTVSGSVTKETLKTAMLEKLKRYKRFYEARQDNEQFVGLEVKG